MSELEFVLILVGLFCMALLFSTVGHGGASGYLAILSLTSFGTMESIWLKQHVWSLNLIVSGLAFIHFYRKGHFEGVIDVMTRLTKIVKPSKIFMGEKDFQQLILVKKYIENNFKSKIVICKTIRDKNKLALSSRNLLLKKNDLIKAGRIARSLIYFKKKLYKKKITEKIMLIKRNELEKLYNIKIEYLELRNKKNLQLSNNINNSKIFIGYYLKNIRLIDNF